jgi:hypothetical protein
MSSPVKTNNDSKKIANLKLSQDNIIEFKKGKAPKGYANGNKFIVAKEPGKNGKFSIIDKDGKKVPVMWSEWDSSYFKNERINRTPFKEQNKVKFFKEETAKKYGKSKNNEFTVTGRTKIGKLLLKNSTGQKLDGEWNPLNFQRENPLANVVPNSSTNKATPASGANNNKNESISNLQGAIPTSVATPASGTNNNKNKSMSSNSQVTTPASGANNNKKESISNSQGATPTTDPAQINTQGVKKAKVISRGQFLLKKDDNDSSLYEIISTTQPTVGPGTYTLEDDAGAKKENLSEENVKNDYKVAKLQFKAGNTIDDLKRENFPDLNDLGEEEFKTILKNCMADGFEFGFGLNEKDYNNNNNNKKKLNGVNTFFIIYLPYNNSIIKNNLSKIKSKYTTANRIRLYGVPKQLLIRFDESISKQYYSDFSYYKTNPANGNQGNNEAVAQGKKFSGKELKNKASMIANIIATNRFLERNDINGENNIDQLKLIRYFENNYTMTKKRALHNIISNILLKENVRPGRQKLMEKIIDELVEKYATANAKDKYAVLDSIIYIIDKLLLFNIKSNNNNPRKTLLTQIENADLGEAKEFIKTYIDQAKKNQGNTGSSSASSTNKPVTKSDHKQNTNISGAIELAKGPASASQVNISNKNSNSTSGQMLITPPHVAQPPLPGSPLNKPAGANVNTPRPSVAPGVAPTSGGYKSKKLMKTKKSTKITKVTRKVKQVNTYTKPKLEKIAKKNKVSLKKRDGSKKTKEELFKSLKRKGLL